MKIDAHTHILPNSDWPKIDGVKLNFSRIDKDSEQDAEFLAKGFTAKMEWDDGSLFRRVKDNCYNPESVLLDMDRTNVDVQCMCTVPVMFNYSIDKTAGAAWSSFLNDDISQTVRSHPDRFIGLGTLPMQDPIAAAKEAERAVKDLGLRGFQVGSTINVTDSNGNRKDVMLSDPSLKPVWDTCQKLGVGIFVHPWDMSWTHKDYWLPWLVGMPAEVSLAICNVMFGGLFDSCPDLKWMFAHGSGSFLGTMGRVQWGAQCRPDLVLKDNNLKKPYEYVKEKRFYLDSITHDEDMLRLLIDRYGSDRICLGSDYPFPLGEVESVAPITGEHLDVYPGHMIEHAKLLNDNEKKDLFHYSALDFFGVDAKNYRNGCTLPTRSSLYE